MSRDEAASYTDFMPDGRAWQFSFEMDVKAVITKPSGGMRLSHTGVHHVPRPIMLPRFGRITGAKEGWKSWLFRLVKSEE
jgi:hypothetical protein